MDNLKEIDKLFKDYTKIESQANRLFKFGALLEQERDLYLSKVSYEFQRKKKVLLESFPEQKLDQSIVNSTKNSLCVTESTNFEEISEILVSTAKVKFLFQASA